MAERKSRRLGIYFILGPAYHGKATLAAALSRHEEILCLGDTNPSRAADQICSCGEMVSSCPFWMQIRKDTHYAEDDPLSSLLPQLPYVATNERANQIINSIVAWAAAITTPKAWHAVYEPAETYYAIHSRFLTSCQKQSPHTVFLDGENSCLKFMVMASMHFPVRGVIHMVRDPRSYAAALKRHYPEVPVEKHGLEWAAAHARIFRALSPFKKMPSTRVRYEDLYEDKGGSLGKITDFMRLPPLSENAIDGTLPISNNSHMIGEAVQRLRSGNVFAGPQHDWREILTADEQKRVIKSAGGLFSEFHYKP